MKQQHVRFSIAAVLATMCAPAAHAIDVTAGDWKLSFDGNVNAEYIYSNCAAADTAKTIGGGLTCVAPGDGQRSSSSVSNGLLPAALSISAATTQEGYDIAVTFGLYPGISTNDGGSPNLANTSATRNTALGSASLDVRQVFLTFGNATMGTITAGRNIGLFQADAILNDMTLLGVGAGGSNAAPTNTSLGSIGYGYIYTDWLAQIDYSTPDMNGVKVTVGIFDPIESLTDGTGPTPKATPGFHGKIAFKNAGPLYLSASFLYEKQEFQRSAIDPVTGLPALVSGQKVSYDGAGVDFGGKYDLPGGFQIASWVYYAKGLGTTALFVNGADTSSPLDPGYGSTRKSYGGLAQVTYKIPETNYKLGFNYGTSRLGRADGEVNPTLVHVNDKFTLGVYDQLTPNLLLLAEGTSMWSRNQVGDENKAWVANVGAFVSF